MQNKYNVEENKKPHTDGGMPLSGQKGRRRWPSKWCLLACILLLVLIILAVGIFLIIYFTQTRDDAGSQAEVAEAHTDAGLVRGRLVRTPGGRQVHQYLGIPFAKPPVGNLRFADPVAAEPFPNGVMEAFEYGNTCPQILQGLPGLPAPKLPLSEDCLTLNIWVPHPRRQKRSVMVWIYGGGFITGSSGFDIYDGKTLAETNDVIVVSFNYRLGVLGFLFSGDGRIKGNYGMKDQILALKWIKKHIDAFGGDPESVTIFGESAGAMSTSLHMFMPQSANLFRRAILQSGVHTADGIVLDDKYSRTQSKAVFNALKCQDNDFVLECLRQKDADDFVALQVIEFSGDAVVWGPTIDGEYITSTAVTEGKMAETDVMAGFNKDEGTLFLMMFFPKLFLDSVIFNTSQHFTQGVRLFNMRSTEEVRSQVEKIYRPENTPASIRGALADIISDKLFVCPTTHFAKHLRTRGVRNYVYLLNHRSSNSVWPPWAGVIHTDDLQWVFGLPLNERFGYTKEEQEFSKTIMAYWTNFAKYGNPNQEALPDWPANRGSISSYIEFRSPKNFSVHRNEPYRNKTCQFWHKTL